MAIVNIPFGGQIVGIEIPDFALEATQRDIFASSQSQLAALQSIGSAISRQTTELGELNKETKKTRRDRSVVDNLRENTNVTRQGNQKLIDGFKAFEGAFQEQSASEMIGQLSKNLGPQAAMAGAFLGTAIGILEKFGEALSKTGRVGVGLGESMEELKGISAEVGTTFDQFAAIVASNGEQLLNFGANTGAGAMSLGRLAAEFRRASDGLGQFGLANDEMIQLLMEEAEVRRLMNNETFRTDDALAGLATRVTENMKLQESMARITGQDVRARIAGQRAIQANVIAQEYLSNQTGDFAEKFTALGAALGTIPGGERIMDAFVSSIATGRDFASFDPALFAQLGAPVRELFETFTQGLYDPSTDQTELSASLASGVSNLRNVGSQLGGTLTQLAAVGNDSALLAISMRNSVRDLGSAEEILATVLENIAALESGVTDIRGIRAATGQLGAEISNMATQSAIELIKSVTSIFGIDDAGSALVTGLESLAAAIGSTSDFINLNLGAVRYNLRQLLGTEIQMPNDPAADTDADDRGSRSSSTRGSVGELEFGGLGDSPDPTPISFDRAELTAAFEAALSSLMRDGLPVDVRNFRDMPRPSPYSSA